ncbi:hypothetical protein E2C01_065375 [Portunus trituberculatus]|uniref:Uncharacterized protein n=1 Tax=Portunus trituberculatus TaxID=210409 RepID=A0A5B7HME8_PORTR|nr:hypothetical protein [Portunus trituberculatus]
MPHAKLSPPSSTPHTLRVTFKYSQHILFPLACAHILKTHTDYLRRRKGVNGKIQANETCGVPRKEGEPV